MESTESGSTEIEMNRFWDFVKEAAPPFGKLPLIHATDLFHFRQIQTDKELRPVDCPVYGEKLLYFFYGRPSYRPHAQKNTVSAKALLPVCLVMSRDILDDAVRIMPFDSGAFRRKITHPPMHESMELEEFELTVAANAPMRVVDLFYGDERKYYDARAKHSLAGYDPFNDLEVDSYFRLLNYRSNNSEADDRVSAIEVQLGTPVGLSGKIHAAILPRPFLDRRGIAEQIEAWGGIGIPYNVKEEFIPREIQGSIFEKLTDFLEQEQFLEKT